VSIVGTKLIFTPSSFLAAVILMTLFFCLRQIIDQHKRKAVESTQALEEAKAELDRIKGQADKACCHGDRVWRGGIGGCNYRLVLMCFSAIPLTCALAFQVNKLLSEKNELIETESSQRRRAQVCTFMA
jgi:hypothetical protein